MNLNYLEELLDNTPYDLYDILINYKSGIGSEADASRTPRFRA